MLEVQQETKQQAAHVNSDTTNKNTARHGRIGDALAEKDGNDWNRLSVIENIVSGLLSCHFGHKYYL